MAMTRAQLAKRLMTLTSKRPEPESVHDELGGREVTFPKKLCGSCSKPAKALGRKQRQR